MTAGSRRLHAQVGNGYKLRNATYEGRLICEATVDCSNQECGASEFIHLKTPTMPPSQIERKFKQLGWSFRSKGHKPFCPACSNPPRPKVHTMNKPAIHQSQPIVELPDGPTMLRILNAVQDHFGDSGYLAGWSDERVSTDLVNVPRAVVAKVREHFGLKIKEDPALMAMRNDLQAVKDMLADLERRFESLKLGRAS